MRLADFILGNVEPILAEWEVFARGIWPDTAGGATDPAILRDDAENMLRAAVTDMKSEQTAQQQSDKSKGKGDDSRHQFCVDKVSSMHGSDRHGSGFDMPAIIAEYRALRASVIRLWIESHPDPDVSDLNDLTRFNESIDQSLTQAVLACAKLVERERQAALDNELRQTRQVREMNEALLVSSVHQQELTEIAEEAEAKAHRSEERLRESNVTLNRQLTQISEIHTELKASRLAALNLMEDALLAREETDRLNRELNIEVGERRASEQALRESEEQYRIVSETASDAIFTIDDSSTILFVNNAAEKIFGYTAEELLGQSLTALMPERLRSAHRSGIERYLTTGERNVKWGGIEVPGRRSDGTEFALEVSFGEFTKQDRKVFVGIARDITERKQAQDRLRASETQLRLVTDAIPALVSYIDKNERYQFVNRQYSEWFGRPREDFLGKRMRDVLGARAYSVIRPHVAEALSGSEVSFDSWLNYKGAGQRYVHVSYVPDRVDGTIAGLFALVSDLSDLKRSQDLLRASEERMRLMTESFTDYAIFSTDNEGRIDSWNPGAAEIFGYSEEEIIGQSSEILFTPEDVVKGIPLKEMRDARRDGRASDERWNLRKDGTRFFAYGVMVPLYVGRVLSGYAKIAADLTERKRSAEALQRAHDEMEMRVLERTRELAEANAALRAEIEERQATEEQKIALLQRLVTSQEDERRRIARDLHDQLGQRLTALRLKIASLRELVGADAELQARTNRLQEIGELLDSEVSFLAWELRPSAIEELGLTDAIGTFAREWSRHYGILAEFHSTGMAKLELDPESDTHLYRIAQEALNNIVKHAKAKKVNILLEHTAGEVILIVEDDGKGFDRGESKRTRKSGKGLGLTGMEERASLIGGAVEIESAPGSGTTVFARVPLRSNGNTKKR